MQRKEHDPARDAGQRAALCRLRRAQRAEARRIRQAVADACLLTPAHLCARRRPAPLAEARQVAMYLMRTRLTATSLSPASGSAGYSATGTTRRCCTASP